jgi:hypothetical protein
MDASISVNLAATEANAPLGSKPSSVQMATISPLAEAWKDA